MKSFLWFVSSVLLGVPTLFGGSAGPDDLSAPAPKASPDIWHQNYLTGDWGETRTKLEDQGVTFGFTYIGEELSNVSGGRQRGDIYEGRLNMELTLDFEKLADFKGGSFYANAYEIHGKDLSAGVIGNQLTVSNIEAYDTLRLYDLWYQQEWLDGKVSLRLGQLAADDEFITTENGCTLINGTFGWPALAGGNLYSGGPAYPLAAPGIRLKLAPIDQLYFMAAVFDGDPGDSAGTTNNPQKVDDTGTRVDFNQGTFSIFELGYKLNQEKDSKGLPGTYKLGGWYDSFRRGDVWRDNSGLSLANPASSGIAEMHPDNWGIYFVADQTIWKEPAQQDSSRKQDCDTRHETDESDDNNQGLGMFWRIGGVPQDRNNIAFYTDGGLSYTGAIPGRDDDITSFGVAYAQMSDDLANFNRDTNAAAGISGPVSSYEMDFEWTYEAVIVPWWKVQPDVQYIIHPGGGSVANPRDPSGQTALTDAVVLGLRTVITF